MPKLADTGGISRAATVWRTFPTHHRLRRSEPSAHVVRSEKHQHRSYSGACHRLQAQHGAISRDATLFSRRGTRSVSPLPLRPVRRLEPPRHLMKQGQSGSPSPIYRDNFPYDEPSSSFLSTGDLCCNMLQALIYRHFMCWPPLPGMPHIAILKRVITKIFKPYKRIFKK